MSLCYKGVGVGLAYRVYPYTIRHDTRNLIHEHDTIIYRVLFFSNTNSRRYTRKLPVNTC
ncbi:hypothetical protein HanXRQr2_Chr03g0117351 [Helianthus annuus]|uniref:Uncharacterized protein n=1 Tax=Helianthus annuus TaxID=4232 RepID=A0A9K3NWF6_HELAN|nr:hypothetical protein HanXRQr2_Chr03g0117351 [Helianthus annuus]KAJ0944230.1 hypothetical protein HanPSC8_Chr03g0113891 [Helianthus annuus]